MQNQTTALAQSTGGAMQATSYRQTFSDEQIALVKTQIAKDLSDGELGLFLEICARRSLDPFARQIYAIKRKSTNRDGTYSYNMTVQTSIDGFRLLAQRTNQYDGQDTVWFDQEGRRIEVWLAAHAPAAAVTTVWRKGASHPFVGVARFAEYAQESPLWKKMPAQMVAKCSEALALRKAFPEELSGLYTHEEMAQADAEPAAPTQRAAKNQVTTQRKDPTPEEVFAQNKQAILKAQRAEELPAKITGGKWMSGEQIAELKRLKAQRAEELQNPPQESPVDAEIIEKLATTPAQRAADPKVLAAKAQALYQRLARIDKGRADDIWGGTQTDEEVIAKLDAELRAVDAEYKPIPSSTAEPPPNEQKRFYKEDPVEGR